MAEGGKYFDDLLHGHAMISQILSRAYYHALADGTFNHNGDLMLLCEKAVKVIMLVDRTQAPPPSVPDSSNREEYIEYLARMSSTVLLFNLARSYENLYFRKKVDKDSELFEICKDAARVLNHTRTHSGLDAIDLEEGRYDSNYSFNY